MRVIFASERDYLPDRVDGAILSVHTLLELVQARGHDCEAIAGISTRSPVRSWSYRVRRLLTRRRSSGWPDRDNGYRTYRAWSELVPQLLADRITALRPDLVLTQLEGSEAIAASAVERSIPVILFVPDVEFRWHHGALADSPLVVLVGLSQFVASRVAERLGRAAVCLYPIVRFERYLVTDRRPRFVTMVNPVREKGIEVTLAVARRLPHREFLLVETWPLSGVRRRELEARLATLPNVRVRKQTLDMREVYRETAVLLAPSQWNEAFGRVLLEAQVSGIPVVASRIGGIPEALRSGAILLRSDESAAKWAEAVEDVLSTPATYQRLGDEAQANVRSETFKPAALVERFLTIAQEHVARCRQLATPAAVRDPAG